MLNTPTFYQSNKTKAQPLGSQLKQGNLIGKGVIVSFYRKRQADIATYYSNDGYLVYQNNIQELMEELQLEHTSGQWRLFTYLTKVNWIAVLLHNENKLVPFSPLASAVHVEEMCEKRQAFL